MNWKVLALSCLALIALAEESSKANNNQSLDAENSATNNNASSPGSSEGALTESIESNIEKESISQPKDTADETLSPDAVLTPPLSIEKDFREDFFGSDGYKHVKKHIKPVKKERKPLPMPTKSNKPSQTTEASNRVNSINRITAAEIYRDVLRSLNESFRVMNKRCKCYGPDVWLGSLPYESADDMVSLKHYRHLIAEYSYHVIQRAKFCGCAKRAENATEKAEERFVSGLPSQVLLTGKSDTYIVTKLDFYRSMHTLEQSMQKAIGKCCLRSTGDVDGTDPDVSTCHIT